MNSEILLALFLGIWIIWGIVATVLKASFILSWGLGFIVACVSTIMIVELPLTSGVIALLVIAYVISKRYSEQKAIPLKIESSEGNKSQKPIPGPKTNTEEEMTHQVVGLEWGEGKRQGSNEGPVRLLMTTFDNELINPTVGKVLHKKLGDSLFELLLQYDNGFKSGSLVPSAMAAEKLSQEASKQENLFLIGSPIYWSYQSAKMYFKSKEFAKSEQLFINCLENIDIFIDDLNDGYEESLKPLLHYFNLILTNSQSYLEMIKSGKTNIYAFEAKKYPISEMEIDLNDFGQPHRENDCNALEAIKSMGGSAFLAENGFWWALTNILFFDTLFPDIPQTNGMTADHKDLRNFAVKSDAFYLLSRAILDDEIKKIKVDGVKNTYKKNLKSFLDSCGKVYLNEIGRNSTVVAWRYGNGSKDYRFHLLDGSTYFDQPAIYEFLSKMDDDIVINICCQLLLNSFSPFGLPDLCAVLDKPALVEVKSEREKLRNNQFRWFHLFKISKTPAIIIRTKNSEKKGRAA